MPMDLPDERIWQLLAFGPSAVEQELYCWSNVWQQLAAAVPQDAAWSVQLDRIAEHVSAALNMTYGSSSSSRGSNSSSNISRRSGSLVQACLQSRNKQQQPEAAAAAAARWKLWQRLQQPAVLHHVTARLAFLSQCGLTAGRTATTAAAAAAEVNAAADISLAAILVQSNEAFERLHPTFSTWYKLQQQVQDKPAWRLELQELQGQQLIQWLPQAAAASSRIAFLVSGAELGQLWQTVGLVDTVSMSDELFWDMFPEARYDSWKLLAALQDGSSSRGKFSHGSSPAAALKYQQDSCLVSDSSSKGSSATLLDSDEQTGSSSSQPQQQQGQAAEPLDGAPAAAAAVAGANGSRQGSSSSRGQRQRSGSLPTKQGVAGRRISILQEYAAQFPPWEKEIRGWGEATWRAAVATLVQSKVSILDFLLQMLKDPSPSLSETVQPEPTAQPRQRGRPRNSIDSLSLFTAVTGTSVEFSKKFALYDTWKMIDDVVAAVPSWSAEWKALRGQQLKALLEAVNAVQPASAEAVRQEQYQLHLQKLLGSCPSHSNDAAASGASAAPDDNLTVASNLAATAATAATDDLAATAERHCTEQQGSKVSSTPRRRRHQLSSSSSSRAGTEPAFQRTVKVDYSAVQHLGLLTLGVTQCLTSSSSGSSSSVKQQQQQQRQRQHQLWALSGITVAGMQLDPAAAAAAARQPASLPSFNEASGANELTTRLQFLSKASRKRAFLAHQLPLVQLLTMPQQQLLLLAPSLATTSRLLEAARAQGTADAEAAFVARQFPWLGARAVRSEVLEGLSARAKQLLQEQPELLLWLQQFAHSWPAWETFLQQCSPAGEP
jgi:hypothetical protein